MVDSLLRRGWQAGCGPSRAVKSGFTPESAAPTAPGDDRNDSLRRLRNIFEWGDFNSYAVFRLRRDRGPVVTSKRASPLGAADAFSTFRFENALTDPGFFSEHVGSWRQARRADSQIARRGFRICERVIARGGTQCPSLFRILPPLFLRRPWPRCAGRFPVPRPKRPCPIWPSILNC